MTARAKSYAWFIILVGATVGAYCFINYVRSINMAELSMELQQMVCLIVMCSLCRSLPIIIGNGQQQLDVSVVCIFATVAIKGPSAAVIVSLISAFFTIEHDKEAKVYRTIYNTPFIKSAFNNSNFAIAILGAGMLFLVSGGNPGQFTMPDQLLPCLIYSISTFLINSIILLGLFFLNKQVTLDDAVQLVKGLIPNVLFAMPLGLLMALLFMTNNGHYLALLMLFPLLIARYAWSLYVDSQQQYMRLISAFVSAMEAKDTYTEGHSRRVEEFAMLIGKELNLPKPQAKDLQVAAILHDIGKIGIEESILCKPTRLTDEERLRIEQHPVIGVNIVDKVNISEEIREMILHHHEYYDGTGYPDHIGYDKVSFGAFILGVADAYDAMTSDRPYRKGMSPERAKEILQECKGTQFHPEVVDAFLCAMSKIPQENDPS